MATWHIALLRTLLVILVVLGAFAQVVVYLIAEAVAADSPELAYLRIPYAVAAIGVILCGQIVLAAMWPLSGRVRAGAIFTRDSWGWVNVMVYAGGVATGIALILTTHFMVIIGEGPPTLPLIFIGMVALTGAFTLLMVTMRGLLRSATEMHTELEEVI